MMQSFERLLLGFSSISRLSFADVSRPASKTEQLRHPSPPQTWDDSYLAFMLDCALLPEHDPSEHCSKGWFVMRWHFSILKRRTIFRHAGQIGKDTSQERGCQSV